MKNSFLKIKAFVFAHKIISVIILAVVMYGGYWIYGNLTSTGGETRYVLTAVTKGTIVSSITGLVLAFLSYTILQLINPNLTTIHVPQMATIASPGGINYGETWGNIGTGGTTADGALGGAVGDDRDGAEPGLQRRMGVGDMDFEG